MTSASAQASLPQWMRFAIVGVANTAVYYVLYLPLRQITPYLAAHLVAWAVSFVFSFFANCHFTFQVRPTLARFLLFPTSTLANVAFTTGGLWLLVEIVGLNEVISPFIAGVMAIPATFVLTRLVLTRGEERN